MTTVKQRKMTARFLYALGLGAAMLGVGLAPGCVPVPSDGGDGGTGSPSPGEVTAKIVGPTISFGISIADLPVAVRYSVTGEPDNIEGYYIRVADSAPGSPAIGDRVILASDLEPGTNQFFNFEVDEVGFYRVGVIATVDSRQETDESTAVITVEGPPDPHFILPAEALTTARQGDDIEIRFDAGDAENQVQWRLFYLRPADPRNVSPDNLGTQLATGSGNIGNFTWSTDMVPPGDYELGLSATDSGFSVSGTVDRGQADRIVTIPRAGLAGPKIDLLPAAVPLPPVVTFTQPGATDVMLFRNEAFTVRVDVEIREPTGAGFVEVFYDEDRNDGNGFVSIGTANLSPGPAQTLTFALPTDLPQGTYNIGAKALDGVNDPVVQYASGTVIVVRTVTLDVIQPDTVLPVRPGDPVEVRWVTNAPTSAATLDVFYQTVDPGTGLPFGNERSILEEVSPAVTSATFSSATVGLFAVSVRVNVSDGTFLQEEAPARVRVSTAPRVLWLGTLAETSPAFDGAIFGGVNFEDNAGTSFTPAGDFDGDGNGDFIIGARYAKPFFTNPQGIGHGEAYLIFGGSDEGRPVGTYDLNSVGSDDLPGTLFTGIRTRQDSNSTDGLSTVSVIPDVDGDGLGELVFGFPDVASRGHNISTLQDGVIDPRALSTLERENQFLRGGIVLVSSQNSAVRQASVTGATINLDLVGQDFFSTCVEAEPDDAPIDDADRTVFMQDVHSDVSADGEGCTGTCENPMSGGKPDATLLDYGFSLALSRDFFSVYVYSFEIFGGVNFCNFVRPFLNHECFNEATDGQFDEYCAPFIASCEPFSPGLHADAPDPEPLFPGLLNPPYPQRHSGFYVSFVQDQDGNPVPNPPLEPLGARIIGIGIGDDFGTSLTVLNGNDGGVGDLVVSAPNRTARGILLGQFPQGCDNPPACGGEIDGLESSPGAPKVNSESGVAYMFSLRSLWSGLPPGPMPPKPHQYIVGEASHSCSEQGIPLIPNVDATRIAGQSGEHIRNIIGLTDFNGDGRNDFAVGAPLANSGQGRVYIGYRRDPAIEGDYVLEKLALDPGNPNRLEGLLITATSIDGLGTSLVTDVDFNGDEIPDLVISSPNASARVGEIIIVFGRSGVRSDLGGKTVASLLAERHGPDSAPVAARIRGNPLDTQGRFGFNIANAGDIDGDGLNDLLIAAPGASPRFDPDPNDGDDRLTNPGLDLDLDGNQDEVPGPNDMLQAGIVYVIYGSNRLDQLTTCSASDKPCETNADCAAGEVCASDPDMTISVDQLGSNRLAGFMIVGRRAGDWLGGGDAGDLGQGGNNAKVGRGRSYGLSSAGDIDGDGRADILIGSILADPRRDAQTGVGTANGGEAYLIYGTAAP